MFSLQNFAKQVAVNILIQINLNELLSFFQIIALMDNILCVIDIFSSFFSLF